MCLTLLSYRYVRLGMMAEHVSVEVEGGRLGSREVYDLFFQIATDWPGARLLCVSPHDLVNREDGRLMVKVAAAPGAGGPDDELYSRGSGHGCEYDPRDRTFRVRLAGGHPLRPRIESYSGTVLTPEARIPEAIQGSEEAMLIMGRSGTVFELLLGDLKPGAYALRLQVVPAQLLGLPDRRHRGRSRGSRQFGLWAQDASIYCAKTCRFNHQRLVEKSGQYEAFAQGAAIIQSVAQCPGLNILPIDRHRIVLIAPRDGSLGRENAPGCIWSVGVYAVTGGRLAMEWTGGAETYWRDDIESTARRILAYLREWASGDPKTKEDVTSALNGGHDNTSLVLDKLVSEGLVRGQHGRYAPAPGTGPPAVDTACEAAATDPGVVRDFDWVGFEIRLCIYYQWLDGFERVRSVWAKLTSSLAFWLALLSVILSILALLWQ